MISYWGVDHGVEVSKSYIPGKGWIPAAKAGKDVLRNGPRLRARAAYDERAEWNTFAQSVKDTKKLSDEIKQGAPVKDIKARLKKGTMLPHRPTRGLEEDMGNAGLGAFALNAGGRRGEKLIVIPKGSSDATVNHELAHIKPERSNFRLYQITRDGKKTMREEARADMSSGNPGDFWRNKDKYGRPGTTDSGYTEAARDDWARLMQNTREISIPKQQRKFEIEPVREYRRVQDRIDAARQRNPRPVRTPSTPEFRGNQWMDKDRRKRARQVGMGAAGAGAGGYGVYRWQKRKNR